MTPRVPDRYSSLVQSNVEVWSSATASAAACSTHVGEAASGLHTVRAKKAMEAHRQGVH